VKKIVISSLLISLVILICTLYFAITCSKDIPNNATQTAIEKDVASSSQRYEPISFSVIRDVHSDTTRLEIAIKDINQVNSNDDLMAMNGDIVDQGIPEHYDLFRMF